MPNAEQEAKGACLGTMIGRTFEVKAVLLRVCAAAKETEPNRACPHSAPLLLTRSSGKRKPCVWCSLSLDALEHVSGYAYEVNSVGQVGYIEAGYGAFGAHYLTGNGDHFY